MVNLFGFDPKDKGSIPLPSANIGQYSVIGITPDWFEGGSFCSQKVTKIKDVLD